MNEGLVIEHMKHKALGMSSYDLPMPDEPVRLAPDRRHAGRFTYLDGTDYGHASVGETERDKIVWHGCEPTSASRIPPRRTKRSFRVRINDCSENREKVAESMCEARFFDIQRAECRRRVIYDQPPARPFTRPDGTRSDHTFDFLVVEPSGVRIAYAVRPEGDVDEALRTAVDCVRAQSLHGFADAAELVTDRHVTLARHRNAVEILDARENRNEADVGVALKLVQRLLGAAMLHDLVTALGLGPRGRTALVCLIDDGALEFARRERLGPATLLRPRRGYSSAETGQ